MPRPVSTSTKSKIPKEYRRSCSHIPSLQVEKDVHGCPRVRKAGVPQRHGSCTGRVGPSLAPDTPDPGEDSPEPGTMRWHKTVLCSHTPAPDSSGAPGTAFYLMELSDETSRSESSASLGGGGGSLSGTAVKAGDFLEKNTRCHLGASRKKTTSCHLGASRKATETSKLASEVQGDARQGLGREGGLFRFQLDGEQFLS